MRLSVWSGVVVWIGVVAMAVAERFWLLEPAVLLPPLVLVPLALDSITHGAPPVCLRILQPLAATAATASFCMPRGARAGLLASSWLAFTLLLAFHGLIRLSPRGWRTDAPERVIDAGLLMLPVGG